MNPGGVRIGTPALTTRGFKGDDFVRVAEFVDRGVKIALSLQSSLPGGAASKMTDFKAKLEEKGAETTPELSQLRKDVVAFARQFPPVGFTLEQMKYK